LIHVILDTESVGISGGGAKISLLKFPEWFHYKYVLKIPFCSKIYIYAYLHHWGRGLPKIVNCKSLNLIWVGNAVNELSVLSPKKI